MATATPICQSLILCDGIHVDPSTGKHFLMGTFSTISASEFPARHPMLALFCELTNGHGKTRISIKLSRVTPDEVDGELVAGMDADVEFVDPRATFGMAAQIANVVFPEPGEYRLFVEADGVLLNERKILLQRTE